jgi:hypothetical protein
VVAFIAHYIGVSLAVHAEGVELALRVH